MSSFRKIQVQQLSANFRQATAIVDSVLRDPKPKEVVIKNYWVGINASDINFTAGKYLVGVNPPFDAGFESVGKVVQVGSEVQNISVGDNVATTGFGAFAEYLYVPELRAAKVPELSSRMVPLLVSGLTASLALEQVGNMKSNQTVLVTAAAGGTGCFAVQLAKLAGNHVIGTCSSESKAALLRSLGCDRVINYKNEDLAQVLASEYPKGIDIVYESVGGSFYDTCVNNLAVKGKLIVIGMISSYQDQSAWNSQGGGNPMIAMKLLAKSASVSGFFLNHFLEHAPRHLLHLGQLVSSGKLVSVVDEKHFQGLEQVPDAIDYMYTGGNEGKVVVQLASQEELAKL